MKQAFKKIVAMVLLLTVFVSTHSFAYFEHVCTITNEKSYSFDLKTCAGDMDEAVPSSLPEFKKDDCCKIQYKVNKPGKIIQTMVQVLAIAVAVPQVFSFEFNPQFALVQEKSVFNFSNSSPPHSKPIYILNQQFII